MSLAMKARQRAKRKGAAKDRVFGCDLVEHLQLSGQDVPHVLKSCTEFVEQHGIVDGIYRLSGVSSNIQKLRFEFDSDRSPDLNKDVYLQDIHCVSSLCKAYFRELPNPLLTYQLYDKFAEAVAIQLEEGRLVKIKEVLKELPPPHYRTLEFLMRHLVHMASYSTQTNMHVRNLAIVWAPNLLRSKDIETSGFNGTAAFMEVRIQSIVVEFILTHVEQLFGDAPLCAGSRESLRKSLLLMGSPVVLADEKYCFTYSVPAVLNQGDGPPQMRPYHTIIELTDSKRKGSLKARKWRSIFNLGRSSNDTKRKLGKMDEKDNKAAKLRLRPAKSMDSLSSVPCISDDDAHVGRKWSQKQMVQCRENLDSPSSQGDNSFLESDEYHEKTRSEEGQGESEGETTAKSEPTTPKASRSSLVGVAPQGRSPKVARCRAEKCAGVHISGPLSVTVPFHITSNLTLSRLTRGLECPALSHGNLDKEEMPSNQNEVETPSDQNKDEKPLKNEDESEMMAQTTTNKEDSTGILDAGTKAENLHDEEENQLSLEVQDSFSFLDSQEAWPADTLESDQPKKSYLDFATSHGPDGFPVMEEDLGSGFMNEIIGDSMKLETFSAVQPLDYLSIEECMNEHLEEDDDQYYLAIGCMDGEETLKEADVEDVYLSANDNLSPLAIELEHLWQFQADRIPDGPERTVEAQPIPLAGELPPGDPTTSHPFEAGMLPAPDALPSHDPGITGSSLDSELISLTQEEEWGSLSSGSYFHKLKKLEEKGEAAKVAPSISLLQIEAPNAGAERHLQVECPDGISEGKHEGSSAPEDKNQAAQPSPGDEHHLQTQNATEMEHAHMPPCLLDLEADGLIPELTGTSDGRGDCGFLVKEADQLQRESSHHHVRAEDLSLEDLPLLETYFQMSPLLGNTSETAEAPVAEGCIEPAALLLMASSSKNCPDTPLRKSQITPPTNASEATKPYLDGSVSMKLTSSTIRVQQVKSFPVVPPKPQFAKIPPSLTPKTPTEEVFTTWPTVPAPDSSCGNEMKPGSDEDPLYRPPIPTSLDMYSSATCSNEPGEALLAPPESPLSLDNCCGSPRQRNSMPVSLENYVRDYENNMDELLKPQCPSPVSLAKSGCESKGRKLSGIDLQSMKCSQPATLDKCSSKTRSNDGKGGETSPKQRFSMPEWQDKHSGKDNGVALPKQRRTSWRSGGSISFDEAVALAKERHAAQAPIRRMQTYCCGEDEGYLRPGLPRAEKPPPCPKPALKSLGQHPLRPVSCIGPSVAPENLSPGKPLLAQALSDVTLERQLSPSHESLSFPQDLPPRSRLSLPKTGWCPAMSEEGSGMVPQERR